VRFSIRRTRRRTLGAEGRIMTQNVPPFVVTNYIVMGVGPA